MHTSTPQPRIQHRYHHLVRLLLLSLSLAGPPAWACTIGPNPTASFGSVSAFAIGSTAQSTTAQPNAGIACPGSTLEALVLSEQWIRATATSTHSGSLVNAASGDSIPYRIFASTERGEEILLGTPYNFYNNVMIDVLGLIGSQEVDIPLTFRAGPTANVAGGIYRDTLTVNWNWRLCRLGVLVCVLYNNDTGTSTISLSLEVTPDCMIDAPDLHFGSAPLIAGFEPVTQTIHLTCTKGSDYTVGLSDGQHGMGATRRMAHDGHYLAYQLYKGGAASERWGQTDPERRSSAGADTHPGTPDGVSPQGFTYRAEILPDQSTPPPGTYTDHIVVEVRL